MVAVKEEREAWDRYAAAMLSCPKVTILEAAQYADRMLELRRKRFPMETGPTADAYSVAYPPSPVSKDNP